jgi:predicted double-glycine peptidase
MASVLNYRGIKVSPEEVIGAIYSRGAEGTLDFDMVLYAGKQGRKAEKYRGTLENLRKNVDSNNPLIVLVDYGFLSYRRDHFMVVLGYDENHIYVNSGMEPIAAISNDEFIRIWKKTNFWTLLID